MLKKAFEFFKNKFLYILLLPAFFVLHGYNENFGFIGSKDVFILIVVYCIGTLIVYFLLFLLYRSSIKASMLTVCVAGFFLFYGAIQDFLKIHIPFAARYRVLLPVLLFVLVFLFIFFKKTKKSFNSLVLFLNTLTCIYVVIDLVAIGGKIINPPLNKFSVYPFIQKEKYQIASNVSKPDIYFLVFDEYASSLSLKVNYGFINPIDTFLQNQGFSVQEKAFSNYHFTYLSIASILNMSYINGIQNNRTTVPDDIGYSLQLIKNNEVIKYLSQQGYRIDNFSGFDLAGNPSVLKQQFLPVKTRLITSNTLLSRLDRDIGWMIGSISWPGSTNLYKTFENNQALLRMTKDFSAASRKQPAFVYAHFFFPHYPFFFDKDGGSRKQSTIISETDAKYQDVNAYLGYLQYSNSQIKGLIDTIKQNTKGKAVIIAMGDHGFRVNMDSNMIRNFQSLNAVYLPGKNYGMFYDSISGVNQFRVIFNTLFRQSLPLLKDSTVFLRRPVFSSINN